MWKPTVASVLDALRIAPPEARLAHVKQIIAGINDPYEKELIEAGVLLGLSLSPTQPRENVVVLVHGIRTFAEWQERLAANLTDAGVDAVYPVGYGFFDVVRFLCPVFTRRNPVERVLRELRNIRDKHGDADISVVAHSFGTYVLAKILDDATDVRLHRLILCGCIIPPKFRWDKVKDRLKGLVLNDIGTNDCWPVLAGLVTWGYGPSGTFGFKTTYVKDRFHNGGHSDFFTDTLMATFWTPFLVDGQVVRSQWTTTRPRAGRWITFLSRFPFKCTLLLILGLYALYHLPKLTVFEHWYH